MQSMAFSGRLEACVLFGKGVYGLPLLQGYNLPRRRVTLCCEFDACLCIRSPVDCCLALAAKRNAFRL